MTDVERAIDAASKDLAAAGDITAEAATRLATVAVAQFDLRVGSKVTEVLT